MNLDTSKAICKSRNGESGNGMRGMMGMWGISVGMMGMKGIKVGMMGMQGIAVGMWGIRVEMRWIGGGNEEGQGENLRIRVEMMNKKCGEG